MTITKNKKLNFFSYLFYIFLQSLYNKYFINSLLKNYRTIIFIQK